MESSVQPSTRMIGGGMTGRKGRNGCYCNPKKPNIQGEDRQNADFHYDSHQPDPEHPHLSILQRILHFQQHGVFFPFFVNRARVHFYLTIQIADNFDIRIQAWKKNLPGIQTVSKGLSKNISEGNDLSCWLDLSTVSLQCCDRFWEPPWFFSGLTDTKCSNHHSDKLRGRRMSKDPFSKQY